MCSYGGSFAIARTRSSCPMCECGLSNAFRRSFSFICAGPKDAETDSPAETEARTSDLLNTPALAPPGRAPPFAISIGSPSLYGTPCLLVLQNGGKSLVFAWFSRPWYPASFARFFSAARNNAARFVGSPELLPREAFSAPPLAPRLDAFMPPPLPLPAPPLDVIVSFGPEPIAAARSTR